MLVNLIFDIILVGILCIGAIMGFKHGFIDTVAKPVKFVAAIAIAFSLAASIGSGVIEPIIGPAISNKLSDILVTKYAEITAETANESLPTLIKFAASLCDVDISSVASGATGVSAIEAIVDSVTTPVVDIMSTIFGFIIVYFVAKIFFNFVMIFVNALIGSGVIDLVNKALGCVFTLFLAFVVVWALTSVSEFVLNMPALESVSWVEDFTGGTVYKFFKSFTPLDLLLSF
jgi:uncharacterized membrane protein required for colicin V production